MVIEQTVEIPANHRLVFDVPMQIPAGRVKAALTLTFENEDSWKERARTSFQNIERLRKKARPDFDYAKELEAARDEKYGRFN